MKYTHNKIVTTEGDPFSYVVDAFVKSLGIMYRTDKEIIEMIETSHYKPISGIDLQDLHNEVYKSVLKDKRVILIDGSNYGLKGVKYCDHGMEDGFLCNECSIQEEARQQQ